MKISGWVGIVMCLFIITMCLSAAADELILRSGVKMKGKVVSISDTIVTFSMGAAEIQISLESVHLVRQLEGTKVFHPLDQKGRGGTVTSGSGKKLASATRGKTSPNKPRAKTKEKADSLAKASGGKKPSWWNSVKVDIPKGMTMADLASRGRRNPLVYVRNVIVPDPSRHPEGVKLLHACLEKVKGDKKMEEMAMDALGENYAKLLGDYPRSLYWWQQAAAEGGDTKKRDIGRACAYAVMDVIGEAVKTYLHKYAPSNKGYDCDLVKELISMNEPGVAGKVAAKLASQLSGRAQAVVLMWAGHAARAGGDERKAFSLYEQVVKMKLPNRPDRWVNFRAAREMVVLSYSRKVDLKKVRDGEYTNVAKGFVDLVKIKVTVEDHKIKAVDVESHRENRARTSLKDVPRRIINAQDVHVDATTHATVTSYAVMEACAKALAGGRK